MCWFIQIWTGVYTIKAGTKESKTLEQNLFCDKNGAAIWFEVHLMVGAIVLETVRESEIKIWASFGKFLMDIQTICITRSR